MGNKNKLYDYRKAQKLTLKEVGDALGLTIATIAGYESGRRKPSADKLAAYAKVLKVGVTKIVAVFAEENEQCTK